MIKATDGHIRSSFWIIIVSVLGVIYALLQGLPAPFNQSKWVLGAMAIIGAILLFFNKKPAKLK